MLENFIVFAVVPSSTSEKFVRGEGLAVKAYEVEVSGFACLMIVMLPGKIAASFDRARSWFPPPPFTSIRRVWNGEPEMAIAAFAAPQSRRVAMCPPHVSTGFVT